MNICKTPIPWYLGSLQDLNMMKGKRRIFLWDSVIPCSKWTNSLKRSKSQEEIAGNLNDKRHKVENLNVAQSSHTLIQQEAVPEMLAQHSE